MRDLERMMRLIRHLDFRRKGLHGNYDKQISVTLELETERVESMNWK